MKRLRFDLSLYLVIGRADTVGRDLLQVLEAALSGGVTLVQLREKGLTRASLVTLGRSVKAVTDRFAVPLIVNDRVEEALAIGAAGVHLGQSDLDPILARQKLGPQAILGLSAGYPREAVQAPGDAVDYLGTGPFAATRSKADARAPIGAEGIAAVRAATQLPIVAIGGLDTGSAPSAIAAGADGVAVVSAIAGADDPASAARSLSHAIAEAKKARSLRN
jgi:thiamine-phosphate pyrophosphorylase